MHLSFAIAFLNHSNLDWFYLSIAVVIMFAMTAVVRYSRIFWQWLGGIRGRDWGLISAVVDVVSVEEQKEQTRYGGEYTIGYLATLTYFYRNPELQTGDYCRTFSAEQEAQSWAASYKGRNILVHVDPRDPTRSVLRKEDL